MLKDLLDEVEEECMTKLLETENAIERLQDMIKGNNEKIEKCKDEIDSTYAALSFNHQLKNDKNQAKIDALVQINEDFEKQIEELRESDELYKKRLAQLYEVKDEQTVSNKEEIINRIQLAIKLIKVDPERTRMELLSLAKMVENL